LTKASAVILCDNKAKNTGIAIAMASIFNEVNVQKNKLEWSSYFLTMPKNPAVISTARRNPLSKSYNIKGCLATALTST